MSDELERELLGVIEAWHREGVTLDDAAFDDLALRVLRYQLSANEPYARYCAALGVTPERMPASWEAIPAVPAAAYKEATLATFDVASAELAFQTSGTTRGTGGRHFMRSARLYDAALLAGFDRFVLADGARLRYFNLVPDPRERAQSSLGYMMSRVSEARGDGRTGWYLRGDELLAAEFFSDLADAADHSVPACIATTAFALARVLDEARDRGVRLVLPPGSRIMETGGFKGRTRAVPREELYARACATFGVGEHCIVAEYGMTELTSQWYDDARDFGGPSTSALRAYARDDKGSALYARDDKGSALYARDDKVELRAEGEHPFLDARHDKVKARAEGEHPLKAAPPWMRARATGPGGATLPDGTLGALAHVDLANLWSCVAVQTEDLGACFGRRIVLLGREAGAELRGCSLDAESLQAR